MSFVSSHRRYRLSIKMLMTAVALCAILLAPVVWMYRRTEARVSMQRMAAENATAQAQKAFYLAQVSTARAVFKAAKADMADQPETESKPAERRENLWAALSVNHPAFKQGQTKDLSIEFTLVNDGANAIDPKIAESRIVINGKELADSGLILSGGLKDAQARALSSGDNLQFAVGLGDHFTEPGTYRVSWKAAGFQSPEILLRVLPEKSQ
jgi:hypothetical protein